MKFNWGTGIVLAFAFFISFILYFVITMNTNKKYKHDLVTKNYYKKELEYQDDIEKEKNGNNLLNNVDYKRTKKGLLIAFPSEMNSSNISGNVLMYRPSNKVSDFKIPIKLTNHTLLIPKDRLLEGRWNLSIDWKYKEKAYLYKQEIVY